MSTISGYERAYKEIVPAARAALILELKKKYKIKEEAISEYIGVTQAAISKYVNGKFSDEIKGVMEGIDKQVTESHAQQVAKGESGAVNEYICTVCSTLNPFNCRFSHAKKE